MVNSKKMSPSVTSPLHFAAFHGHHAALQALMTVYTDLNMKDENGCTPLDLASYAGHVECVSALLTGDKQADCLVYSHKSKRTSLHAAGKDVLYTLMLLMT